MEEKRFCGNCGAEQPQPATNFCPQCGVAQRPDIEVPSDVPMQPQPGRIPTPNVPNVPQPINIYVNQSQQQQQQQQQSQSGCGEGCGWVLGVIFLVFVALGLLGALIQALSGENGLDAQVGALFLLFVVIPLVCVGGILFRRERREPGSTQRLFARFRTGNAQAPPENETNYGTVPPDTEGEAEQRERPRDPKDFNT